MKKVGAYVFTIIFIINLLVVARVSNSAITDVDYGESYVIVSAAALAVTASTSSDALNVSSYASGSIQVVWADQTASGATKTATYDIRSSTDGSNYDQLASTENTTSGTSGTDTIDFASFPGHYLKVYITGTNASSGTITPYLIGKKLKP